MGVRPGSYSLTLGLRQKLRVDVVTAAQVLPGRRSDGPVLLVDGTALGPVDRSAGRWTEFWTDDVRATQEEMARQDVHTFNVTTGSTVRSVANYLGIGWAFGYLAALAALVGVVAVGGLLLYLETRQRQRTASYALARRMGLSGRAHLASLVTELGALAAVACVVGVGLGWVAVLSVYGRLELDPARPPGPLLTVPTAQLVGVGVAAVAVALLAAGYAHLAAHRAKTSEVMRLGA